MTAALQRFQKIFNINPSEKTDTDFQWVFKKRLAEQNRVFFSSLLPKHTLLAFEYNVLCTHLAHDFFRKNANPEEIKENLIAALMMAEVLEYLFKHYLAVPREIIRLQNDQLVYRQLLANYDFHFDKLHKYKEDQDTFSQFIRSNTAATNWLRLSLIRAKRVLNALVPFAKNIQQFCVFMETLDKFANPVISYLAWIFFVPRLTTNLFLLLKHLIPGGWMSEKEIELTVWQRLHAQLLRRWFELGNDSVWMVAGILNCFVFLGPLAPVGIYLNVALYIYDVALASIRAAIEIRRIKKLQAEYSLMEKQMIEAKASPEALAEIGRFQQHLQERINFEQKRLLLSVGTTTALAIAIIICIPALAVSPVVPFIGAALLLSITLISYGLTKLLEKQRPSSQVTQLIAPNKSLLLFKPAPVKPQNEEELSLGLDCLNDSMSIC